MPHEIHAERGHRAERFASPWDFIADQALAAIPYYANEFGLIPSQLVHARSFLRTEKGVEMMVRKLYREFRRA